jgi:hypothetical protein
VAWLPPCGNRKSMSEIEADQLIKMLSNTRMAGQRDLSRRFLFERASGGNPSGRAWFTSSTWRATPRQPAPMPGLRRSRAARSGDPSPCCISARSTRRSMRYGLRLWRRQEASHDTPIRRKMVQGRSCVAKEAATPAQTAERRLPGGSEASCPRMDGRS